MFGRRGFILTSSAAILSQIPDYSFAQQARQRVRPNVATQQGKAMLAVYAQAVRAMKAKAATDTRSWTFQWYTHAIPVPKATAIQAVFRGVSSPASMLAQAAWYTCQPHVPPPGGSTAVSDYFAPWHRLYVLFLEEIVQNLTGRPDFALPYWDYTSPSAYAIPPEFRTIFQNDPVFGTLFQSNRNVDDRRQYANVNAGEPINKYFMGSDNPLNLNSMKNPVYAQFNSSLNSGLHGSVHDLTGNENNMGYVPTAAEDPVFWLHHSNIDRVWYSWNAAGHTNPTSSNGIPWANTYFVFANAAGQMVRASLASVSNSSTLPYTYDQLLTAPRSAPTLLSRNAAQEPSVLFKSGASTTAPTARTAAAPSAQIDLAAPRVDVPLQPAAPTARLRALSPKADAAKGQRLIVSLRGVMAQTNPNSLYRVYINLPPNASKDVADTHFVGLLNFFGRVAIPGHSMPEDDSVEYDVTDVLARLAPTGGLEKGVVVTLIPAAAPAEGSSPMIAGGVDVEQR